MQGDMVVVLGILMVIVALVVGVFVYFIPAFVAFSRQHPHRGPILLVNIFAGWTLFGWVAALIWSLASPTGGSFDPFEAGGESKICPRCAERVKRAALMCRFCGYDFTPPAPPPPPRPL